MTEYELQSLASQAETLEKLDLTITHLHNISIYVVSFFKIFGILIAAYIAVWFVRTYVIGLVRTYFRFRI